MYSAILNWAVCVSECHELCFTYEGERDEETGREREKVMETEREREREWRRERERGREERERECGGCLVLWFVGGAATKGIYSLLFDYRLTVK